MDSMTMNDMRWIEFDRIEPNPYRDLVRNPIKEEHLEVLKRSVQATGFWNTCIVRPWPDDSDREMDGHYQLMFGHARVEAAKQSGITGAFFAIRNCSDEEAIVLMTNENATQNSDRYPALVESVRAAMGHIMLILLRFPEYPTGQNFLPGDPNRDGQLIADLKNGGHIGEDTIYRFFNGTLSLANIRLAIQNLIDTGEIEAWHKTNNPFIKDHKPIAPVVSHEAIAVFDKPDHVRTFTKAVKEMKIPVEQQPKLVKVIKSRLAEPPRKLPSGRDGWQASVDSDRRFNSANIRKVVIEEGLNLSRNSKTKRALQRMEHMTTLEKNLTDIESGLTRAASGYNQMKLTIKLLDGLQPTDYSNIVEIKLKNIAESLRRLERLLKVKDVRSLLTVTKGE